MSDGDHIHPNDPSQPPCGDAAAYALGALEPAEAQAFRVHLQGCAICREELAAFTTVTDVLPMTAVQVPVPPELRRRVIDQVRTEAAAADGGERARAPARRSTVSRALEYGRPRWPVFGGGLLAALAAVALALILIIPGSSSGTRVYDASVGHARLVVSDGRAELVVAKLPIPVGGRTYEVWLLRSHHATPAGLFVVGRSGTGRVTVPGDLSGITAVAVTQEPAGGTLAPTTAPVILTPIA